MKTVETILKDWLKEHDYTGLYTDNCGCELDNFAPCDCEGGFECQPGYWREGYLEIDDSWDEGCFPTKEPTAEELKKNAALGENEGGT